MLLIFRGVPATLTATVAGIGGIIASGSTVSATVGGIGAVNAPTSIELQVFATVQGTGTITAIPQGFLTRTATVDGTGSIAAFGGFGDVLAVAGLGGVTATVGSFFDGGALSISGSGAVSAAGQFASTALVAGVGAVSAVPTISGGTLSLSATVAGRGDFAVSRPVLSALAIVDGSGGIQAAGSLAIPTLATQMRLSFSADEMRLFFRKG